MEKTAGPYTPVVRSGNWIIVSGQIGHLATLQNVLKTTVFLTDIDDYGHMNEIYTDEFEGHRPARSAIAVAALPLGALIEIEAWAKL